MRCLVLQVRSWFCVGIVRSPSDGQLARRRLSCSPHPEDSVLSLLELGHSPATLPQRSVSVVDVARIAAESGGCDAMRLSSTTLLPVRAQVSRGGVRIERGLSQVRGPMAAFGGSSGGSGAPAAPNGCASPTSANTRVESPNLARPLRPIAPVKSTRELPQSARFLPSSWPHSARCRVLRLSSQWAQRLPIRAC